MRTLFPAGSLHRCQVPAAGRQLAPISWGRARQTLLRFMARSGALRISCATRWKLAVIFISCRDLHNAPLSEADMRCAVLRSTCAWIECPFFRQGAQRRNEPSTTTVGMSTTRRPTRYIAVLTSTADRHAPKAVVAYIPVTNACSTSRERTKKFESHTCPIFLHWKRAAGKVVMSQATRRSARTPPLTGLPAKFLCASVLPQGRQ